MEETYIYVDEFFGNFFCGGLRVVFVGVRVCVMAMLCVRVPVELRDRFKERCVEVGVSEQAFVRELLARELERPVDVSVSLFEEVEE